MLTHLKWFLTYCIVKRYSFENGVNLKITNISTLCEAMNSLPEIKALCAGLHFLFSIITSVYSNLRKNIFCVKKAKYYLRASMS